MPSPFPGMDPYLEDEKLWPGFHNQLVHNLYQILLPGLMDRYRAKMTQRQYVNEKAPDTPTVEQFIEIRQRSDDKLITLMDVVSPANKTTTGGRAAYLEKRREGRNCTSNLVEIDLVLQGQPMLDYSREGLPDWDYAVTVTRSSQPERNEIYTSTLEKRLPRFRLPLAADDRDTVVDLQSAFTRTYEQGNFAGQIDYGRKPKAALKDENRRWIAALLKWPSQAEEIVTHEEIAVAAYFIWMELGCPAGCADEHWQMAIERLKQGGK